MKHHCLPMTALSFFLLLTPSLVSATSTNTPAKPTNACDYQTPLTPGIPGSPTNLIQTPYNPNGSSELAVLMRRMLTELRKAKKEFSQKKTPVFAGSYDKIRCAWPTTAGTRTPLYDKMANSFLQSYDALRTAKSDHAQYFDATINNCIACHQNTCLGPIPAIESLRLNTSIPKTDPSSCQDGKPPQP